MYQKNVEQLFHFMEKTGKSQQQIAREMDLSPSVISQFLNQSYRGNNEEVARSIEKYLELSRKRASGKKHVCFNENLHNTQSVLFACNYAHTRNDITLVCGDAGAGKTTALEYYQRNNIGVVMITANSCTSSATAILNMLNHKTGKGITGRKDVLMSALVSYFKGTGRLIIIDEADHLTLSALQAIRNLNDEAAVGIVLSGNNKIYNQMLTGSKSSDLQQLKTRIIVRRKVENRYMLDEFKQIFPGLPDDCLAYLIQIAESESLRTAVKMLEIAYDCAEHVNLKVLKSVNLQLTEGLY